MFVGVLKMSFKRKFIINSFLISSVVLLSGCPWDDESSCSDGSKSVTSSDGRTICVTLSDMDAFTAPGKISHKVFVSDIDGNPINVSTDDVLTGISQYPMMTMMSGHKHSAPFKKADTSAAEDGAYSLDVYYPMPSETMDGTVMGDWEYRISLTDNNGTADDDTDDETHTVHFAPTIKMLMSDKVLRAVGKNESDKFKSGMDIVTDRQYFSWLESVGKIVDGEAETKIYLTTQDMDHSDMAMSGITAREETHVHDHGDMDSTSDMADTDSQTYPAVHAPMDMMGDTMTLKLHDAVDNAVVDISTVTVAVSTDDGANWTMLMAGMSHDELGYYNASVPMDAGDVTMLVKVTVNGNVMTKTGVSADGTDAEDMPALKFTAAE